MSRWVTGGRVCGTLAARGQEGGLLLSLRGVQGGSSILYI